MVNAQMVSFIVPLWSELNLVWEASRPDIFTLSYKLSATIDFEVVVASPRQRTRKMTSAVAEAVVTLRQNLQRWYGHILLSVTP